MEDLAGEKEIMPWKKNADGTPEYYYKKIKQKSCTIQKDWFSEHGYKRGKDLYPQAFYKNIESKLSPRLQAYWALTIDGDGSIDKHSGSNRVRIGLKDREPIQFLADLYGASISMIQFPDENWAPVYTTHLHGKRAFHFLRLICPYMTEKRKRATQLINLVDPNYHPPKIPMNFRKYPELISTHMGMIGGFFDTEGSVGIKARVTKFKTKTKGTRFYNSFSQWIHFTNTNLRPLRKIKKILESWPFIFKPKIYADYHRSLKKNGELQKIKYKLVIPRAQHLLFMALFSPVMLIQRKKNWLEKFKMKKQIYEICKK